MTTYTLDHPEKGLIKFKDKKRHLWWGAVLFAAIPLFVILIYLEFKNPWILLAPFVV